MSDLTNTNEQQNESGKIEKAYAANIKKLTAILGGQEQILTGNKIQGDVVNDLVQEMLIDKKKSVVKDVKEGLTAILDKRVAMNKAISEEKKKLAKFEEEQKKAFNQEFSKVLGKIEGIGELERSYYATITDTTTASQQTNPNEETT